MNFPLAPPVGIYSSSVLLKCLPHLQSFVLLLLAFILLQFYYSELIAILNYQVDSKIFEGRDLTHSYLDSLNQRKSSPHRKV